MSFATSSGAGAATATASNGQQARLFTAGGDGINASSASSTPGRHKVAHIISRSPDSFIKGNKLTDEELLERQKKQLILVKENFTNWDRDGDGKISVEDASQVLKASNFTTDDIQHLLSTMTLDSSGSITYDVFKESMLKKMALQHTSVPYDLLSDFEESLRGQKRSNVANSNTTQ
jgi:hypothetical protein